MTSATTTRARNSVLGIPMFILLAVFLVVPLGYVFWFSFHEFDPKTIVGDALSLGTYRNVLSDPYYLATLWRTVWIAFATTIISLLIGFPIALHMKAQTSSLRRGIITVVVVLPIILSLVVTGFAWLVIFGSKGLVNSVLMGLHVIDEPMRILGTNWGVIIVLVYSYLPYMVLSLYGAIDAVDPNILRASDIHGASRVRTFWTVLAPITAPGIASGVFLVFGLSLGAFVTPLIIGQNVVSTVPVMIYDLAVAQFDWPGAAALGVVLLIATLALTFGLGASLERRFLRRLM